MENRITCGTHLCQHAVIDNSKFLDVSMARVEFDDVNMQEVSFNNINMQQVKIHYVNLKGAQISDSNLADLEITGCGIDGMINGVLVTDMMGAYFKLQNSE